MKTKKKNNPRLKQNPKILKKGKKSPGKASVLKKKALGVSISGLKEDRNHLQYIIRQKNKELRAQNIQLQGKEDRQLETEGQVYILTKATEAAADGIFVIDAQTAGFPIVYANPSFKKMSGHNRKELLGVEYLSLFKEHSDLRIVAEIENKVRSGENFHGEIVNFEEDGRKYWSLLRMAPVFDLSDVVTHYIGIQTDISLIRKKDLEFQEQREELLHVTRVGKLAEFVSSLAHEISQPLTAILSYAQAAQRMLADREPEIKEIFQNIVEDNQRATEVIRRLRSLLKKGVSVSEPVDINFLINETVVLIGTDVIVRNKAIKTDLTLNLPRVLGDRIQLQQVLLNLISNSLDAMESNPDSREILIRTTFQKDGMIFVEVIDSGCGIPKQNIAKLFHRFFTSKADGLGMGLSISRSIVEAHGGRLDVKNNPTGGAIFYFTLPVGKKDT